MFIIVSVYGYTCTCVCVYMPAHLLTYLNMFRLSSHKIDESSENLDYAPFVHLIKWMLHHEPEQRPDIRQVLVYLETMEVPDNVSNLSKYSYGLLLPVMSSKVGYKERYFRKFSLSYKLNIRKLI